MRHLLRATALLVVLTGAVCCATVSIPDPRSPRDQYAAGVSITTSCDGVPKHTGTGSLVSDDRVLTALHVVHCDEGELSIVIDAGDGPVEAKLEIVMPMHDLARLRVTGNLDKWFTPVQVGSPPPIGAKVCWAAVVPRPTYRCGTSQGLRAGTYIWIDGMVEHGNSGSPLYDASGKLVGVVQGAVACEGGINCLGEAMSLRGLEWLVP